LGYSSNSGKIFTLQKKIVCVCCLWGVVLDLDIYIFSSGKHVLSAGGGHHRSESSSLQANMVTSCMSEYVSGMTAFNSQTNLTFGVQTIKFCSQVVSKNCPFLVVSMMAATLLPLAALLSCITKHCIILDTKFSSI
jgi:hypothetical protein